MNELHVGLAVLGVPLLLIGVLFLRHYRLLALVYLLAVVVGLGYLVTTGAVKDVGTQALTYINGEAPEPAATETTTPAAPATPPAETTPAPTTPEPAPTTTTPEPAPTTPEPTEPAPATPAPTEPAPSTPSDGATTPAPAPAP